MNRVVIALVLLAVPLAGQSSVQDAAPAPARSSAVASDKFSGTVTALTAESLTVVRTVPARDAVTRVFTLSTQTKVEGKLRLKARVTVQYEAGEEGQFRAMHIIVR